tara:strand:- start:17054 stop:17425 length:372 start_codon:yes stop_codon:yes gene_type:complete
MSATPYGETIMDVTQDCRTCTIRELNDALRTKGEGGQILITRGLKEKDEEFIRAALQRLREFDHFTPENDPYGDHDFGRFVLAGEPILWKIDYYDESRLFGSDDPSNPAKTTRVLTLMLADEY